MVLADLGPIDFIFLATGNNPEENVRKTSTWFSKRKENKRRVALRASRLSQPACGGQRSRSKEAGGTHRGRGHPPRHPHPVPSSVAASLLWLFAFPLPLIKMRGNLRESRRHPGHRSNPGTYRIGCADREHFHPHRRRGSPVLVYMLPHTHSCRRMPWQERNVFYTKM